MSVSSIYRWHDGTLVGLEYCDMTEVTIAVADSWLVTAGTALGIGLHRTRFLESMDETVRAETNADEFWDAAIALIPRDGDWFPRVELQRRNAGGWVLVFRLRDAPELTKSVSVATWDGPDPRTQPLVKGPDLEAWTGILTSLQPSGAQEAVVLEDGFVAEGARTGLLWWRGDILCGPPEDFDRVDSVTVRSVLTLATALGIETFGEPVTPAELDGTELWALNALHGIRIVTRWIDGPSLAERPGRLATWRSRMDALRKSI
jgi:branched-subunit amino acid aminotransferase/4-amino-4-deoxychorismate lyase